MLCGGVLESSRIWLASKILLKLRSLWSRLTIFLAHFWLVSPANDKKSSTRRSILNKKWVWKPLAPKRHTLLTHYSHAKFVRIVSYYSIQLPLVMKLTILRIGLLHIMPQIIGVIPPRRPRPTQTAREIACSTMGNQKHPSPCQSYYVSSCSQR